MYQKHIEYLHHVTYSASVRRSLDEFYTTLECGETPSTAVAALLMSIFASVAAFQFAVSHKMDLLGIPAEEARLVSLKWTKATFDCLDNSRRAGWPTLEDLQANVTIFFLMYNLEGFSTRSRMGTAHALSIAKDLSLHKIDSPGAKKERESEHVNYVELEIKRRVWWHMAATDWCVNSQETTNGRTNV